MNGLPLEIVNNILVIRLEECLKKIKELEDEVERTNKFIQDHGGVCCEDCGFWDVNDEVCWYEDIDPPHGTHLCSECWQGRVDNQEH